MPSAQPSSEPLPEGYRLRQGSGLDRSRLLQFMRRTYRELYPSQNFDHLAQTVEAYFSGETPLWWIDAPQQEDKTQPANPNPSRTGLIQAHSPPSLGCLWMGTAIDQVSGERHAHIFLLYVAPEHRRKGLGRSLMKQAEDWAQARGDRKISLQVFNHNAAALALYESMDYQPQSIALVKSLPSA